MIAALCVMPASLLAGASHPIPQDSTKLRPEVSSISLEGNVTLTSNELLSQMMTRETPGWFSKFLYSAVSENLGRKDEFFDPTILSGDLDRLRTYYGNRGFSEVRIDTFLRFSAEGDRVDVTVRFDEGYRSIIDSLTYVGFENASVNLRADIATYPLVAQGDPFNISLLEEEVKRVLRLQYDYGYPNARYLRDSSYARRFASTRNYDVQLVFSMGRIYRFGDIFVRQQIDSSAGMQYRPDITDDLILDHMDYHPTDRYSLRAKLNSETNLNRLGVFELRGIDLLVPRPEDTSDVVQSIVTIRPLDKHELAPDLFVSDEDGAFNIGASLAYTQRNFFGGGRRFTTRLRFRTQTITAFPDYFNQNSNSVSNLDLTFELFQPYVFSNTTTGTWSFSAVLDKQKPYIQDIVRNKIGITTQISKYATGFFDWTIESVTLRQNENFDPSGNDPEVQRALRLLQKPQRNSFLSFTAQRDRANDLFSPSAGYILSGTMEESGIIARFINRIISGPPYTQFYRVILMGRWYKDVSDRKFTVLAYKARIGWEEKYGESRGDTTKVIPQTHRFFAGGGGSVRGWASRELIARGDAQLGGNVLFETSLEIRTNIFQSFKDGWLDKVWLVQFVDVGQLWQTTQDIQISSVAAALGLGLRYDTTFGPFRIDWGLRIYDPRAPEGQQWITQRKLFSQTFKEGVFHFGIGHSF